MTDDYRYIGPMSLSEALLAAEKAGGVALALSVPDGELLAVSVGGRVLLRKKMEMALTPHASHSIAGTGRWLEASAAPPNLQWRPL